MNNKLLNRFVCFLFVFSSFSLLAKDSMSLYDRDYKKQLKDIRKEEKKLAKKKLEAKQDYKDSSRLAHQKNKLSRWADKDGYIWFYDEENKHTYFLSNFYPCSVKVGEFNFACAEAAFQAYKFTHIPELFARFRKLDGDEAWKLGQRYDYQKRQDWYQVRETIMLAILRAKFQQNPNLVDLLVATGNAYLVEHTKRDTFWADGKDGRGQNRLGNLLMQLRGEFGGVGVVSKSARYRKFVD